jgi:histone demethylase JARID1
MGSCSRKTRNSCSEADVSTSDSDDKFGFQSGPDFTLKEFQQYDNFFKDCYFGLNDSEDGKGSHNEKRKPSEEEIEGEYWRIIEQPTDEVEVLFILLTALLGFQCNMFKKTVYIYYHMIYVGLLWS